MTAHNGSRFESYIVLKLLLQWRSDVVLTKNGAATVSYKIINGYVDKSKKIPQYVHFRFGGNQIDNSLKKIGISYKLQPPLMKQDVDHDEIHEDTWKDEEKEWLPYLKNGVLSTAFYYARYSKGMEKVTRFALKNTLIFSSLADKYLKSLRDEGDEPFYTHKDE